MNHAPSRTTLLYITAIVGAFFALYQFGVWGYDQMTGHAERLEANDSAYARSTRAVQWIDEHQWKLNFIGPVKPKQK